MKGRSTYEIDPEEVQDDPYREFHEGPVDPDANDDAYTIDRYGNTVSQPTDAAASFDHARKPWVMPLAVVLVIAFVGLSGWNLKRAVTGPPPLPKPTAAQVKQTLYMGVMRVNSYRRAHGVTPETLEDAGLPENSGYTYRRVDSIRYVLAFENGGPKLEYDSTIPKETFFGSPREVLSMGGAQ